MAALGAHGFKTRPVSRPAPRPTTVRPQLPKPANDNWPRPSNDNFGRWSRAARSAGRLGRAAGRFIPGIGWIAAGYDAYQLYQWWSSAVVTPATVQYPSAGWSSCITCADLTSDYAWVTFLNCSQPCTSSFVLGSTWYANPEDVPAAANNVTLAQRKSPGSFWYRVKEHWWRSSGSEQFAQELPGASVPVVDPWSPAVRPYEWPITYPALHPEALPIAQPVPVPRPLPYRSLPRLRPSRQARPRSRYRPGPRLRRWRGPNGRPAMDVNFDHKPRPPRKREKENKQIANPGAANVIRRLFDGMTEIEDFVEAMWKGLPRERRSRNAQIPDMIADLYKGLDDWDANQAFRSWFENELEDRLYGKLGQTSGKASRRVGRAVGLQTGPWDRPETPEGYEQWNPIEELSDLLFGERPAEF